MTWHKIKQLFVIQSQVLQNFGCHLYLQLWIFTVHTEMCVKLVDKLYFRLSNKVWEFLSTFSAIIFVAPVKCLLLLFPVIKEYSRL